MNRPDMNRFGSAVEWAKQGSRGDERIILEMAEQIHNYIHDLEKVVEAAKNLVPRQRPKLGQEIVQGYDKLYLALKELEEK